eukprot:688568-Pleurochrysis_carterae.AAC.3
MEGHVVPFPHLHRRPCSARRPCSRQVDRAPGYSSRDGRQVPPNKMLDLPPLRILRGRSGTKKPQNVMISSKNVSIILKMSC